MMSDRPAHRLTRHLRVAALIFTGGGCSVMVRRPLRYCVATAALSMSRSPSPGSWVSSARPRDTA